jgi:2-polyprenyl-6-methoxyphenol hydroxylase-like FAD-dependent oxidoreductase
MPACRRPLQRDGDGVGLGVKFRHFLAHLAAPTGLLIAAKGQRDVAEIMRVDPYGTRPDTACQIVCNPHIARPDAGGGPDRHIVTYYVKPDRSEVYFVTSQPDPGFAVESWSAIGDVHELRAAFADFHSEVRHVLAACPVVNKWALVDRDPLPRWSEGNVALLGDACHPMTPYMAQGAAMAIEDAAALSRCLENVDRAGAADAFRRFEATRKPRTSRMQLSSRTNTWLRDRTDPGWVYGYNA